MKVTYTDGKDENFIDANEILTSDESNSCPEGYLLLIKRSYDSDGNYDEEEDESIVLLNEDEIRCVNLK